MQFSSWSGVKHECVENDVDMGGSTCYRLLICLGVEPSEGGEMELDTFIEKLRAAQDGWGPGAPGYPDEQYIRDYGRGRGYIEHWLDQLHELCGLARDNDHKFIVWF